MDGRRHSVDLPISRTLVALRRVRSLRDPSTNSISKLSSLVDNLNWETHSSSAITLGFGNNCNGDYNHEFNYSSRYYDSGLVSPVHVGRLVRNTGSRARPLKQEMVCERIESSRRKCNNNGEEGSEINSKMPSTDCIGSGDSFSQPKRRFIQAEKRCRDRAQRKSWNRKQHNKSSRVTAGDVLCPVVSPCLSTSDAKEGSSSGVSFYVSVNEGMIECVDRGGWSKTPRFRQPKLLPDVEEQQLLLEDAGQAPFTELRSDCQNDIEVIGPYLETPRSLCQKFMPKSFEELVGQNVIAKSLLSAISNGRIASLYLFHGQRGTGKTSAARVFAAALICLSPETDKPCGLCKECISFFSGRSTDVKEVDSMAINSFTRLRSLIIDADIPPVFSSFKVYIVDECHLLQGETWAALLRKIEELHRCVVFIMVTPDLDKLPSSVASKSQSYHFQAVKVSDIANILSLICEEEGLDYNQDALNFIATKSNGSVRDAEMTLDQLSLLSKKITLPLVYEVIGVVSDGELLELLQLALSSDASNMIKRARELTRTRVQPLQLISQLANLIMDILSGKCEGVSEIRRKLFGHHNSEADMQQLRNALKILSDTEKQLRLSKNQTTWLTVALLQLSSAPASHDALNLQEGDCRASSTSESLKFPAASSCENTVHDDIEALELIWTSTIGRCKSTSLKNFLQKRGKLVSLHLNQGAAELEFDHPNHMSKAERSWKAIAGALQLVLGHNVELRINLSSKYAKMKRPFSLFNCSRRVHLGSNLCAECGSNVSEYSSCTPTTFITRDRYAEMCSSDCGSQITHACFHGKEMVTSIRNSDGNALSIGVKTPHRSLPDSMEGENPLGSAGLFNKELNNGLSRRREHWTSYCWRTAMFPFRKLKVLLEM